jgi:hypothetical protein
LRKGSTEIFGDKLMPKGATRLQFRRYEISSTQALPARTLDFTGITLARLGWVASQEVGEHFWLGGQESW